MVTQREYDLIELAALERRLADVTAPSRQTAPTEKGRQFRESLEADIARLRGRISSEEE